MPRSKPGVVVKELSAMLFRDLNTMFVIGFNVLWRAVALVLLVLTTFWAIDRVMYPDKVVTEDEQRNLRELNLEYP